MEKSEALNELAAALSKAQSQIEKAKEDSYNPGFKSKYADLGAVWDACRDALTKNGLSVAQTFEPTREGYLSLRTTLLHSSGQWFSGVCEMPMSKQDPQGYGSAATYARRYGLMAMVGVCPDDDDANAASGQPAQQQQPRRQPESRGDERATRPQPAPAPAEPGVDFKALRDRVTENYKRAGYPKGDVAHFFKTVSGILGREVRSLEALTAEELKHCAEDLHKTPAKAPEVAPESNALINRM